jgi:hypothetical protein
MAIRWLTIFLDLPATSFPAAEQFWLQVTGGQLSPRRGPDGEFATVLPADGDAYLRVQRIRDGAGGRHLDLHIDGDDEAIAAVAARAVALGSRVRHVEDGLTVVSSPGGFAFCLVRWDGESKVPNPVQFDVGGANRLDQLCLDIPADVFETECGFWSSLTGWALRASDLPEFCSLERPAEMPVRLLFQRRAEAATGAAVTAHIDFGCDDRRSLTDRHVELGARVLATFPQWTTLADVVGEPYCLTDRRATQG